MDKKIPVSFLIQNNLSNQRENVKKYLKKTIDRNRIIVYTNHSQIKLTNNTHTTYTGGCKDSRQKKRMKLERTNFEQKIDINH